MVNDADYFWFSTQRCWKIWYPKCKKLLGSAIEMAMQLRLNSKGQLLPWRIVPIWRWRTPQQNFFQKCCPILTWFGCWRKHHRVLEENYPKKPNMDWVGRCRQLHWHFPLWIWTESPRRLPPMLKYEHYSPSRQEGSVPYVPKTCQKRQIRYLFRKENRYINYISSKVGD